VNRKECRSEQLPGSAIGGMTLTTMGTGGMEPTRGTGGGTSGMLSPGGGGTTGGGVGITGGTGGSGQGFGYLCGPSNSSTLCGPILIVAGTKDKGVYETPLSRIDRDVSSTTANTVMPLSLCRSKRIFII
jgi:hypothetical protein